MSKTIVLGGGIAGLSFASFLDEKTVVLERAQRLGGLSCSYQLDGIAYDIGPHIIFSKNKEVLDLHTSIIPTNRIRRSNQIFYKGRYVKYPFENDLAKLPPEDRDYCLKEFINNPYENYESGNMLQFFLKTFGEGITRLYLQPYNQKIWKFDPACMDIQMVERIPKPPKDDVIASANGVETEGYTHQLYFHYPAAGGFQTLVDAYAERARKRGDVSTGIDIKALEGAEGYWRITTQKGVVEGTRLINCIPLHELFVYLSPPAEVKTALDNMKYNAIHIVAIHVKKDMIGDHFAIYFPDPDILFHRVSKLNFLGDSYTHKDGSTTLLAEVTFRPGSYLGSLSVDVIQNKVIDGLESQGMIAREDVISIETQTVKYAYVIYDLDHRKNTDLVLSYLRSIGIRCVGRFAEFEYLNTDAVVERSLKLAREINQSCEKPKVSA
jgi:protoporphyrinogen oxidase